MSIEELRIDRETPRPGIGRKALWGVVVLLALAGSFLCWRLAKAAPLVDASVAVETSGGGAQETVLNASGYVTARRQATVSSKVTGQITEVLFEEGQKAEAGQVLARVDPSEY